MDVYSALALFFALLAIGVFWSIRIRHMPIDSNIRFWPPRLSTTVIHPTSAISFQEFLTELSGTIDLPMNALEGDSHRVKLMLRRTDKAVTADEIENLRLRATQNEKPTVLILAPVPFMLRTGSVIEAARLDGLQQLPKRPVLEPASAILSVELLAPGCELAGASTQTVSLLDHDMMFYWGVLFKTAGTARITVAFKVIEQRGEENITHNLGSVERDIRVRRMAFLTGRLMGNLAWLAGGIAGILAALKILKEMGWLGL